MDLKSMAKSKRSHTQHNQPRKPHHHHHPPKPTFSTNNPSNSNKDKTKVVDQKPRLPSNWDRYDDDDDFEEDEEEEEAGRGIPSKLKKAVEGVKRQSKGADFRYLIAQAKDSNQEFSPSFADTVHEFYQGLTPMLDVKSEGIPSWVLDDDFLLENEATSNEEEPNFSLDLKALSEELAKTDLAKRLFIEPELLAPQSCSQDANAVSSPKIRVKTFDTFQELYSIYLADEKASETDALNKEVSISDDMSDTKLSGPPVSSIGFQETSMLNVKGNSGIQQAPSPQTVTSLDDELDDLLASSSLNKKDLRGNSGSQQAPLLKTVTDLDYELDDLLDGSILNKKAGQFQMMEVKSGLTDGPTRGALIQDLQDPSMSAFPVSTCGLDDELDSLLEETSKPTEAKTDSSVIPPSSSSASLHPGWNIDVMDDFDPWFDALRS